MPELPEVENIKLQLNQFLIGHRIERVEIRYARCFDGSKKKIEGAKVIGIRRFGKVLSIDLNNENSIVIHIKLTGQLIYKGPNLKKSLAISKKVLGGLGGRHTHVIFHLSRMGKLYYNDFRKFGWIKILPTDKLKVTGFVEKLGPEPITSVTNSELDKLTLKKFKMITGMTKRTIKTLLLDQSKISGIGNIYANDALWLAKIHPERKSHTLSNAENKALFNTIEQVLHTGLKHGGASELSFVTPDGKEGEYQKHFLAYGRAGEICTRCKKGIIKKIKLGGRGTYFCPVCQSI